MGKNILTGDRHGTVEAEHRWRELSSLQVELSRSRIVDLFAAEPDRVEQFGVSAADLYLDFSKSYLSKPGLAKLIQLAEASELPAKIQALFAGAPVNNTEQRPALHMALRNKGEGLSSEIQNAIRLVYLKMDKFVGELHSGLRRGYTQKIITDVVNIGIGGSDLGPVMAVKALGPYRLPGIKTHFVSNVDGTHITETLKPLRPDTTLFIVASKSFNTIETKKNAEAARAWCVAAGMQEADIRHHFVAVSTNIKEVVKFGIAEENIFPLWDWVGGRYSLWSAIGLPIAVAVGMKNFSALLAGGGVMDRHFQNTPLARNMPVILGLLSVWYTNFFNAEAQLVIPYDQYLSLFPAYLQQLEMESNGKSVHKDGTPVNFHTKGALFGEAGTNTQHSFHQLLHQGTHFFPVDFIVPARSHNPVADQHAYLYANCLSQSQALMEGKDLAAVSEELRQQGMPEQEVHALAAHKVIPGNRPSNTIVMKKLTPETLGALIALYEHKVYVESVIWNINAFDQWGVELGKKLSEKIFAGLADKGEIRQFDPSTRNLLKYYKENQ